MVLRIPNPIKLKAARSALARLYREEAGQDLIEYALLFTFIALGTITGIHGVAAQVSGYYNTLKQAVASNIGTL